MGMQKIKYPTYIKMNVIIIFSEFIINETEVV